MSSGRQRLLPGEEKPFRVDRSPARVAELADAHGSGPCGPYRPWRFESSPGHLAGTNRACGLGSQARLSIWRRLCRLFLPLGDRRADQVAPFGPGAVIILDVLEAEQVLEHEPGVARALADAAVSDDRFGI